MALGNSNDETAKGSQVKVPKNPERYTFLAPDLLPAHRMTI